MWWWHTAFVAWAAERRALRPVHTFSINASLCESVLPHFYEDSLLSWQRFTCDDVHTAVRKGFDAWSYNSRISFREVVDSADIVLGAQLMNDTSALAFAQQRGFQEARIVFSSGTCWYMDSAYCDKVHETAQWVVSLLVFVWSFSFAAATILLCRPARHVDPVLRIVVWSVFLAIPISAFGTLTPCFACYDFTSTVMHEVGHAIGFSHSDGTATVPHRCGCGANTTYCDSSPSPEQSIMYHSSLVRSRACLGRDDADGVRSLYGGNCDDPVWCYATSSFAGFTRLSISFVYSFIGAWMVVFLRSRCARRVERTTAKTRAPIQPVPATSVRSVRPVLPVRPVQPARPVRPARPVQFSPSSPRRPRPPPAHYPPR